MTRARTKPAAAPAEPGTAETQSAETDGPGTRPARYVTFHVLNTLSLHNLNRDQNGLPKSHFDGGVQRARLSSQSLKRAAREAFRDHLGTGSVRTRVAPALVVEAATAYADEIGVAELVDTKKLEGDVTRVLRSLTNDSGKDDKKTSEAARNGVEASDKVAMVLLSDAEITTLARTAVDAQLAGRTNLEIGDVIVDATSAGLDIAAFGRMFANQPALGTHAAVAVSHAVTTHPMVLVSDYFSAVDDAAAGHGAGHLGMSYYTSGVYYRSFTVDVDQLHRSWSGVTSDTAAAELAVLLRACLEALPKGKTNATNAHTLPTTVVVESTRTRFAYDFDTPVTAGPDGGFKDTSVAALAAARRTAAAWDAEVFVRPAYLLGETTGLDGEQVVDVNDLVTRVAADILVRP